MATTKMVKKESATKPMTEAQLAAQRTRERELKKEWRRTRK